MRVHCIQVAYDDAEPVAERIRRVAGMVREQAGADLVVLPELWAPGGFSYRQWDERAEDVRGPVVTAIAEAAREIGAYVHAGSIIEHDDGGRGETPAGGQRRLWNTSVLLDPRGEIVARYRKIHRFGFGVGEPKLLQAGEEIVTATLRVPEGDVVVGLATCYDLRFPEMFRALLDAGTEVALVPAAWPTPRIGHWSLLARARAIEDFIAVVAVNTAGTHARTEMGGRSVVVAADGAVLAEAGMEQDVLVADIDVAAVRERRVAFPALADRRL